MKKLIPLLIFLLLFTSCCTDHKATTINPTNNEPVPPPPPKMYYKTVNKMTEPLYAYSIVESKDKLIEKDHETPTIKRIKPVNLFKSYSELTLGKIAFNIPETMILGDTYIIDAKIGQEITDELTKKGYKVKEIKISDVMTLNLRANPSEFKIESLANDDSQLIIQNNITTWTWLVTPLKKGTHNLILIASVVLENDNKVYDLPIMEYTTNIKIDIKKCSIHFLLSNWQYLLSAIVFPIIVWLIKRKFEKGVKKR